MNVKEEITTLTNEYIKVFPKEYESVKSLVKVKRVLLRDPKYAKTTGHGLERALLETPETLDGLLRVRLSEEALTFMKTKKGIRWFAEVFPAFRLPEKI